MDSRMTKELLKEAEEWEKALPPMTEEDFKICKEISDMKRLEKKLEERRKKQEKKERKENVSMYIYEDDKSTWERPSMLQTNFEVKNS